MGIEKKSENVTNPNPASIERVAPPLIDESSDQLADVLFSSKTFVSQWVTLYHDLKHMSPTAEDLSRSSREGDPKNDCVDVDIASDSNTRTHTHTHAHHTRD